MRAKRTSTWLSIPAVVGILLGLTHAVMQVGAGVPNSERVRTEPVAQELTASEDLTLYLPLVSRAVPPPTITNGGFEQDWSDGGTNRCLVYWTDGTVEDGQRDNIFSPPGWTVWFRDGNVDFPHDPGNWDGWKQPEAGDTRATNPNRMHAGEKGFQLFSFMGVHDGGLIQQVSVMTGTRVQLDGWAHAWSNLGRLGSEHPHDPAWSEGSHVGYNPFSALEGTSYLDSSDRNFTFWLGLDPTGGTHPDAPTVIWGRGAHIYNAFAPVPPVIAAAQGPTVTVFLRSRTLWRFEHNDAYWDDVSLTLVAGPAP